MPKSSRTRTRKARKRRMAAPALLNRQDLAQALHVAPGRITKWVADGAPVAKPGARGHHALYELEAVRKWVEDRHKSPDANLSLADARRRLATAQATKVERENAVRAGHLVERAVVVAEGQNVLASLKARLLALPRQAVLRGVVAREVEPALSTLVSEALRELARWDVGGEKLRESA